MSKEYEVLMALSGKENSGRPKTGASLYHEYIGSDGSCHQIDSLYIEKPEVRIYRDFQNMVIVDFVYEYPDDADLIQQYMFLQNFFQPENSVSFSEEQFFRVQEQGSGLDDGLDVLYVHYLLLNVISLYPRGKYALTATEKPLFYQLMPERPGEEARILRLVFHGEDVILEEFSDEETSSVY